ncbi:MAG: hypothetical protein CW338_04120 [Clostridiales bacterium]|nr:hypothetical protein [Clostridiales bacterium]
MIWAVSFNPCTDKTVLCEHFDEHITNRVMPLRNDLGGKAVNCALALRALGVPVTLCGMEFGGEVQKGLGENFPTLLLETGLPLRVNLKIFDKSEKRTVEVNESGEKLPDGLMEQLKDELLARIAEGDIVILSGSLPYGEDTGTYAAWCSDLRARGAVVIADCSGETLYKLLPAGPDLIKPNQHEMEDLLTRMDQHMPSDLKGLSLVLNALRHQYHIRYILCSLGKDGALLSSDNGTYHCTPPPVEVRGDVGAGDAMTAAAAWQISLGADESTILRFGTAAAGAVLIGEGTCAPDKTVFAGLTQQVAEPRKI